jgi:hypothetical protein
VASGAGPPSRQPIDARDPSPGSAAPVPFSVGGLPPGTRFRLVLWNGAGAGTNVEIGYLDSGATGVVEFSVPQDAVFALTTTSLGSMLQ